MKIEYIIYCTRLEKPVSIHSSIKKAREHKKELYGSSSYVILQVIVSKIHYT